MHRPLIHRIAIGVVSIWLAAIVGLALLAARGGAQSPDPACLNAFKRNADSAAKAHLSSTQLTAYQRRVLTRLDSLARVHCPATLPAPTVSLTLTSNRDTITQVRPTNHWARVIAVVRVGGVAQAIDSTKLAWSITGDVSAVMVQRDGPDRFEVHSATRSGSVMISARWIPTNQTAAKVIVLVSPAPAPYDSTASIQVLFDKPNMTVGDSAIVCAVFTTKSGAKGIVLLNSIQNDAAASARLTPNLADTTAAPCLPLVQRAGITLTPGLAPRAGTWSTTKDPPE